MKRHWILGATIALLGLAGYLLYNRADNAMATPEYAGWSPDAKAIRQALGKSDGSAAGQEARLEKFCKLFQSRFREHEPMMAVGLRPINNHRLKLMCPARMEPVDVDSIAMIAWHEAQDIFGQSFDLDLYWTFIGTPPVKIGELRLQKDNPKIACITYHYPETVVMRPPMSGYRAGPFSPGSSQPAAQPKASYSGFSKRPPSDLTDKGPEPAAGHP